MTTYSIIIETDGKLCGRGCPWLPKKWNPVWGYDCKLFDKTLAPKGERHGRCYGCKMAERRLKRMKP